jgi:hypothetical protein
MIPLAKDSRLKKGAAKHGGSGRVKKGILRLGGFS